MSPQRRLTFGALFLLTLLARAGVAHSEGAPQGVTAATPPAPFGVSAWAIGDGPLPPEPPAVLSRDDSGRATMRAVRIDRPLRIDGDLDEEIYQTVPAAGDFIQQVPQEGAPETEKTEVWVFFDADNLYVSARCWDGHPERWVITELRRDSGNIFQNEHLSVSLDTFHDRRNGFVFQTTPLGALRDLTFTDETTGNVSWNTVFDARSGRFDGGWTVEMTIPFKSLRYRGSGPQVWGIQFKRKIKWKNENTHLTRVAAADGDTGVFKMSVAATLVGIETPAESLNLELKPYVIGSLTTDRAAANPFSNRTSRDAGFDFKFGLTRSLIADATYNTDFAQVEEDLQQVNLTRFSLLFPEKRDFFLEGQGIFAFGGAESAAGGAGGGAGEVPILFFSRRIGFSQGEAVPVIAGGRLTGTVGKFAIGALSIQTDDKPSAHAVDTNFSVIRLKRDILRRSNMGFLMTHRTPAMTVDAASSTIGADAHLAFFQNLTIAGYYARTAAPARVGDQSSYRGKFDYAGDRYGLLLDHNTVGDAFNPEVGFMRRSAFRRNSIAARFSPRPTSSRIVRKLDWNGGYDYITDSRRTRVENRRASATFQIDFHNSDQWVVDYTHDFEFLPRPFAITRDVLLPIGGYVYDTLRLAYNLGQQHRVAGRLSVATGTFYNGTKHEATFSSGRLPLSRRLIVEPGVTLGWVDLPEGRFETRLVTARTILAPSPRSVLTALFQYNGSDRTLTSSVRMRWEYRPGSDLFMTYSDNRNQIGTGISELVNKSVAIKLTRLLRF